MAATITLKTTITISDADLDTDSVAPQYVIEKSITNLTSLMAPKRLRINNATQTIWSSTATGEQITTFQFLAIWASGEIELELTCNDGDAAEAIFTVKLAANVPFLLGSDDSRYNTGALTGTADVIDLIRIKEGNTTNVDVWYMLVEA